MAHLSSNLTPRPQCLKVPGRLLNGLSCVQKLTLRHNNRVLGVDEVIPLHLLGQTSEEEGVLGDEAGCLHDLGPLLASHDHPEQVPVLDRHLATQLQGLMAELLVLTRECGSLKTTYVLVDLILILI